MRFSFSLFSKKTSLRTIWPLLVFCIALSACTSKAAVAPSRDSLIQSLAKQGVTVTTVGDAVAVVVPSDLLFNPHSANLNSKYSPVLMQVAKLLKTYTLVSVRVVAYNDDTEALNLQALTTKQAQRVAIKLWNQAVDARLIYAEGGANTQQVVKGGSFSQRAANRRVEIRFRYYLPVSYYD